MRVFPRMARRIRGQRGGESHETTILKAPRKCYARDDYSEYILTDFEVASRVGKRKPSALASSHALFV